MNKHLSAQIVCELLCTETPLCAPSVLFLTFYLCPLSLFLSLSLSPCNISAHTIDPHGIHKEMNVGRLRDLLKVIIESKKSYFRGLILYTKTYCFIT